MVCKSNPVLLNAICDLRRKFAICAYFARADSCICGNGSGRGGRNITGGRKRRDFRYNSGMILTKRRAGIFLRAIAFALLAAAVWDWAAAHNWESATRASANLAPSPDAERGAVIQAYAARLWGWRGIFADHTWISVKPENAAAYTVYEVVGWRLRRGLPALRIAEDIPDRHWFGGRPRILVDVRGAEAESLAAAIAKAAAEYPFPRTYRAFPGPNSNTFTAWIAERVPQLGLDLPLRAVGKGFVGRALEKEI